MISDKYDVPPTRTPCMLKSLPDQPCADPLALPRGVHGDRSEQKRLEPTAANANRPKSDRARNHVKFIACDQRQAGHRINILAQAVGGQPLAPCPEGSVQQRLDLPAVVFGFAIKPQSYALP